MQILGGLGSSESSTSTYARCRRLLLNIVDDYLFCNSGLVRIVSIFREGSFVSKNRICAFFDQRATSADDRDDDRVRTHAWHGTHTRLHPRVPPHFPLFVCLAQHCFDSIRVRVCSDTSRHRRRRRRRRRAISRDRFECRCSMNFFFF
jgi:hypothetical protein